jgi:hypothetical protein
MPISMHREDAAVVRADVRGTLRKAELDACQQRLLDEFGTAGPVRLLFVLEDFNGWEDTAAWNDLSFFVRHGDAIARIAIVGPEKWRSQALMFAGADLRPAPVEYFPESAVERARAWLRGSGTTDDTPAPQRKGHDS